MWVTAQPFKSRATMRDVADRAGVSLKTVSRVVNAEPGVTARTQARVFAAIGELGFRRNEAASALRKATATLTIGVVIEDLSNPFYGQVARAVEAVIADRGGSVIVGSTLEELDRERRLIRTMLAQGVDAFVITAAVGEHRWLADDLAAHTVPVVWVDRAPDDLGPVDMVVLDNRDGARRAVEHLVACGHRRIAVLADDPLLPTVNDRLIGYAEALRAAGLVVDENLVVTHVRTARQAVEAARRLLARGDPPTAFFAVNNRASVGALTAFGRAPARPALIGFDDVELADLLVTPLSVVAHDAGELGRRAGELALRRLEGQPGPPEQVVVPVELVIRGGTERLPGGG
jgi:LacI family transcriptional regulator